MSDDMLERMVAILARQEESKREAVKNLPDAPVALVDLIADAMEEFGPDGHCDGCEIIAAIVWDWFRKQADEEEPG
jgi:hypothetical protein